MYNVCMYASMYNVQRSSQELGFGVDNKRDYWGRIMSM